MDQNLDDSLATKREKNAQSAEAREVQAQKRGIGNYPLVLSRKQNDKRKEIFGAARREELRKALSYSKEAVMKKLTSGSTPPASSSTSSGNDAVSNPQLLEEYPSHFEHQVGAHCGLHALNNALGMDFLSVEDMRNACASYLAETAFEGNPEPRHMHANENGWYSEAVMTFALRQKNNLFVLDVDNPVQPEGDDPMRIYEDDVLGIVINKNQNHWMSFRMENGQIWNLDSLHQPRRVNYDEYVATLREYRNAFAVRPNHDADLPGRCIRYRHQ